MEQKKTEFNKVFNAWDILVIAFGAGKQIFSGTVSFVCRFKVSIF